MMNSWKLKIPQVYTVPNNSPPFICLSSKIRGDFESFQNPPIMIGVFYVFHVFLAYAREQKHDIFKGKNRKKLSFFKSSLI